MTLFVKKETVFTTKEYEGEWKAYGTNQSSKLKIFSTEIVSPLLDKDLTFYFNAIYQINSILSLFQLRLEKLTCAGISPTLEVSVSVKVNYPDGSLFVEYPKLLPKNIDKMKEICFEDVVRKLYGEKASPSTHCTKMVNDTVIIKCKMTFSDKHRASSPRELKSCKCVDIIGNFKSLYHPSVLSDFTFKVGDRSFHSHKVILAAHSPVFMKMMTHEFLESKTSTVIITDATPEIFDSFLRSLYSGEIGDKSLHSLKELYRLADKYDVIFLKKECTTLIISYLSVDLVCDILKLAYRYSDSIIKTAAINFAVIHIKEIITSDDWKELVKTHPTIGYEVTVNFIPK